MRLTLPWLFVGDKAVRHKKIESSWTEGAGFRADVLEEVFLTEVSENIYWGQGAGHVTPKAAVQWWMGSAGHRANLLRPGLTHLGMVYARVPTVNGTSVKISELPRDDEALTQPIFDESTWESRGPGLSQNYCSRC